MVHQGCVFDIRRYAIHDGPGIRLNIFFKGCPLSCMWCHNPEGQDPQPELMFDKSRCLGCGACEDRSLPENCPSGALQICGQFMDTSQVMKIIHRERLFFDRSGGGVTFTGGEPLMQPDFLVGLLRSCRESDISSALDTSLYAPEQIVKQIIPLTSLFLTDIKLMDPVKHRYYTGVDNTLILNNMLHVARSGVPFALRIPLVHGVNDSGTEIDSLVRFAVQLRDMGNLTGIHLLPYHNYGQGKTSRMMGKKIPLQRSFSAPPGDLTDSILLKLRTLGFNAVKGG
ncbi:MAG: glycyl-radical enzyme activating protein [Bacteroidales bacterium]|jgi:pyruvate formate lyase activating enzyme|nr:glycyl-radical enzyme activating protein [Bacteroidales bacterium]MDD2263774.1 glycyl-radical enzyme activating protein [Bacteroidales bacterium]MDD2831008.1 glycyl-radical enzyme activating protein [Bacteroidales bacterium]MDD3208184.1 glycyl-radical enzyme activating protein [Bacteroidales bacterium]MDD3696774.1 glycyl-radical enzyme activating protein [Bacteroidales bacterium]